MITHSIFPSGAPYAHFTHCPRCGKASLGKIENRAIQCTECDFIFYFNCASSTAAFIFHQDKLLMGIRGKDPQKGMLDFPGGFIEFDETAEQALAREVEEELNIKISSATYLTSVPNDYIYADVLYKTTDLYFICGVEDISNLKAMDDVAGFRLALPEEIDPQCLAFESGKKALQCLLEYLNSHVK